MEDENTRERLERRANTIVMRFLLAGAFLGAALFVLCYKNFFTEIPYLFAAIFALTFFAWWILARIFIKFTEGKNLGIKYFLILAIEFSIAFLSIAPNVVLFIAYIIAPLLSCIYRNRKFTVLMSVLCYAAMIGTLVFRSIYHYTNGLISIDAWLMEYCIGTSVEYFVCVAAMIILCKRNEC